MQVPDLHALFEQIVGEVLGHLLRECRDEHALVVRDAALDHFHQIIDLPLGRLNGDFGIDQAGRANNLLDDLGRHAQLIGAWGGREEDALVDASENLFKGKRSVVACRREAKAVLDQHVFSTPVARELAMQLRHSHVALVDHEEVVVGEVVEQGERRLTRLATVDMHRVVLDAVAVAELTHHLEVIRRAHPETLRFEQLVLLFELFEPDLELMFDLAHCSGHSLVAGDVVSCGEHMGPFELAEVLAGERVDHGDAIDGVAEHLDAQHIFFVGRMHFDRVAPDTEVAAAKGHVVAVVLHVDEAAQDVAHVVVNADGEVKQVALVLLGIPHTVDTGHRRHHDDVLAGEERGRGRVAQPLDVVVD